MATFDVWLDLSLSAVDEELGAGDEACVGGSEEDGPIPVVPPVTTAIFPSSLRTMICLLKWVVPWGQIYGGMLIFKIEMYENHRCRIVDVKATGFRRARDVREGRRRRFVCWGGNNLGSLGRHGLSGRNPPRGTARRSTVQPHLPTTCTHGLWPHACRASGENLRRGRGGRRFRT